MASHNQEKYLKAAKNPELCYKNNQIITNTCKFDHITLVLQELCWLPVSYDLMCMVDILTFKCVKGLAP